MSDFSAKVATGYLNFKCTKCGGTLANVEYLGTDGTLPQIKVICTGTGCNVSEVLKINTGGGGATFPHSPRH